MKAKKHTEFTYFAYSAKTINEMIIDSNIQKIEITGVYNNLKKLKTSVEELYDNDIFWFGYCLDEAPHFGRSWSNDMVNLKNIKSIDDGINQKIKEIYALILAGLGEKCKVEVSNES